MGKFTLSLKKFTDDRVWFGAFWTLVGFGIGKVAFDGATNTAFVLISLLPASALGASTVQGCVALLHLGRHRFQRFVSMLRTGSRQP